VTVPGVTLKGTDNEMAGSTTVPVVAVLPEMNRNRLLRPSAFNSKVNQKSVPADVCAVVAADAGGPARTPTPTHVDKVTASTDSPPPNAFNRDRVRHLSDGGIGVSMLAPAGFRWIERTRFANRRAKPGGDPDRKLAPSFAPDQTRTPFKL